MQPSALADDLPEIDESQHTEVPFDAELPVVSGRESESLFVSGDSPEAFDEPAYLPVAVQNPEPPSSYLAGAYEAIDSSQVDQSSSAPVQQPRAVPEPSQFVPDPADTTTTTEGTTIITLAPTTPSEPSRSAPATFGDSANIIPDSQTFVGSASFVPSAERISFSTSSVPQSTGDASHSSAANQPQGEVPPHSSSVDLNQEASQLASGTASSNPGTADSAQPQGTQSHSENSLARQTENSTSQTQTRDFASGLSLREGQSNPETSQLRGRRASPPTAFGIIPKSAQHDSQLYSETEGAAYSQTAEISTAHNDQIIEELTSSSATSGLDHGLSNTQQASGNLSSPAVIDLISATQEQYRSFDPTPDQRIANSLPETAGLGAFTSSAWFDPISPFETQIYPHQRPGARQHSSLKNSDHPHSQPSRDRPSQRTQLSTITPRASSLPVVYSPIQSIESIPHPPVQSIEVDTTGGVEDPRQSWPSTPKSSLVMDPNQTPSHGEPTLLEKLNAVTTRSRRVRNSASVVTSNPARPSSAAKPTLPVDTLSSAAPLNAARLASPLLMVGDRARSPSAVPASEPLPIISQEEMNSVRRYETLLPQAQDDELEDTARKGSLVSGTASKVDPSVVDAEATTVHTLPIGMAGHQRDQYRNLVWYYHETISEFLQMEKPNPKVEGEAIKLLERARNVAMHPDLDNAETLTQYDVEPSQQADWDVQCSAKFRFLATLLKHVRGSDLHIALVCHPGRLMHLLRTFLEGTGHSSTAQESEDGKSSHYGSAPRVTLVSPDDEGSEADDPADIVIAMHSSISQQTPAVETLRKRGNQWSPFVTLIVPYTIEHLEFSISSILSEAAKTRALVSGIYQLRGNAGKLEEGQLTVPTAAELMAKYLRKDACDWPPPSIQVLEDLDSQTESEIEVPETNGVGVHPAAGVKRPLDTDNSTEHDISKRPRFASSAQDELEISQISDSVGDLSQTNALGDTANALAGPSDAIGKRLQQLLLEAESRVREGEQALANLQYRHEEQRTELVQTTAQRDAAIETAQASVQRMSEQPNLRSRVKDLEQELKEANERLLSHNVPAVAEFAALQIATADAVKEKEKAVKSLERLNSDNAYVRELYQESSSRAQQLAAQNTDLENALAVAQNRATGEQARLRQMGFDSYTRRLEKENQKMKDNLKDREAGIKFRDDEIAKLKEASRGRMGTRGTSVPRSPRLGSPMKMGGRSRQGSPVLGELRGRASLLHPLRNA